MQKTVNPYSFGRRAEDGGKGTEVRGRPPERKSRAGKSEVGGQRKSAIVNLQSLIRGQRTEYSIRNYKL
jgi:hypothetical protein